MTIDSSLKRKGRLSRSRNVLKRDERIARLMYEDRWDEKRSPFGLPKVRVIKSALGKKKKKKSAEEEEGGAAAPAAKAAAGAKGAPAAKAAPAAKGSAGKK